MELSDVAIAVTALSSMSLGSAWTLGSLWMICSEVLDLRDLRLRLLAGGPTPEPSTSSTTSKLADMSRTALPCPASLADSLDLLFLLGGLSMLPWLSFVSELQFNAVSFSESLVCQ